MATQVATHSAAPADVGTAGGTAKSDFRLDIEGLRGLAILSVLLMHIWGLLHGGVDISFSISGFLITLLLLKEHGKTGEISFAKFYARRARRLLPAAAIVSVATLGMALAWMPKMHLKTLGWDALLSAVSGLNIRLAFQATNYFADTTPSAFEHMWSLNIEEQYYAIWPALLVLLLWITRKLEHQRLAVGTVIITLMAGSMLATVLINHVSQPWAYLSPATRAWELMTGALAAVAAQQFKRLPEIWAATLTWLGLVTMMTSLVMVTEATPVPYYGVGAVMGSALLMGAGSALPRYGAGMVLSFAPLRWAGRISYSMYLWHWPLLVLLPYYFKHPLNGAGRWLVFGASIVLAAASYPLEKWVREHPTLKSRPSYSFTVGGHALALPVAAALAFIFVLSPQGTAPVQAAAPPSKPLGQVEQLVADGVNLRQLPSNLVAQLPTASQDAPDGCLVGPRSSTELINCWLGDSKASKTIAMIGDSKAWQWLPAMRVLATTYHFKMRYFPKAGCTPEPYAFQDNTLHRRFTECEVWRDKVLATVLAMHPASVILTSDVYKEYVPSATTTIVGKLRAQGIKVAYIDTTPAMHGSVPDCLSVHRDNVQACNTPVTDAYANAKQRSQRAQAAKAAGATFVDPHPWFCTDQCPAVVDGMIVYLDDIHVSARYAKWLAPHLGTALQPVLN